MWYCTQSLHKIIEILSCWKPESWLFRTTTRLSIVDQSIVTEVQGEYAWLIDLRATQTVLIGAARSLYNKTSVARNKLTNVFA